MRRLLSAAVLLVAGVAAPATSAAAVATQATSAFAGPGNPTPKPGQPRIGIRLVDVPVSEADNPRGLRYIIDHLPPGAVIHRRVLVENQNSATAHVTVYADAAGIRNGAFIGAAGQTRSELTTWIGLSRQRLTMSPHSTTVVTTTIKVPRDASPGERYGVIWAQEVAHRRVDKRFAINEVSRVRVPVYLSVGPGGPPPTNFIISGITGRRAPSGRPAVTAHVANTGGRAVDLSGNLRLTDGPGGLTAGPFRVHLGTHYYPFTTSSTRSVYVPALPATSA